MPNISQTPASLVSGELSAWQALTADGVRVVRLPLREVGSLDTLALSLSQHCHVFFVVVLPLLGPAQYEAVWATLSGGQPPFSHPV